MEKEEEMRGLEVVFHKPLHKIGSGISPGGAVFPFEYLQTYDLEKGIVVLRGDYGAFKSLSDQVIVFQSDAPNTPQIWAHTKLIASIKDLNSNTILFPKSKTD